MKGTLISVEYQIFLLLLSLARKTDVRYLPTPVVGTAMISYFCESAVYFSKGLRITPDNVLLTNPLYNIRFNCDANLSSPDATTRKIIPNIQVKFTLRKFSQPP